MLPCYVLLDLETTGGNTLTSRITEIAVVRMAQEIRRVEWRETAGELGALLLEARLVKDMQPIFNRQLRRERSLCPQSLGLEAGKGRCFAHQRGR